jgi:hypothetical protein
MKKLILAFIVLSALAGGYLLAAHLSGGALYAFGLPLGSARGELRRAATSFLEDIQFKDFKRAASYHAPEKQAQVDIPFIIQRLFQIKPEALDIMRHEIVFAEVDSTGLRGRVKARVKVKDLIRGEIRQQELLLYFERQGPRAPWHMKLEDSLRELEPEKGKRS